MSYIKSYGVAFPSFRIDDNVLHYIGKKSQSKAICFSDEDLITLAYESSIECVKTQYSSIDAVFFATNSPVFQNRYHSAYIADLLGINNNALYLDFIGTNRCSTDALMIADQFVNSGKYKNILLVAADVKYAEIGDEIFSSSGHAAIAVHISNETGIAKIDECFNVGSSISEEFIYKNNELKYDPRYIREIGFKKNIEEVVDKIKKYNESCQKVILNSKYSKLAGNLFIKSGFKEQQFAVDTISRNIGNVGSSHVFLQLIQEIENGTNSILLIDYTNGSNVILINNCKSLGILKRKIEDYKKIESYQDYLKLRKVGNFNSSKYKSKEIFSSEMMNDREKSAFIRLIGIKCKNCGTCYFIKTEKCKKCKSQHFETVKLSRTGQVYSFTREHYFPVAFPPVTMLVIDLDGGGRVTLQQTDCISPENNKIEIGSKVRLVLRKMIEQDYKPNYFFKAVVIE
ncbi:MAG: OB-fold domain-containing protein [Bacteroidia bacterium]|nr:OB-fold domain-containing protein [Bacteroidia bacterium]